VSKSKALRSPPRKFIIPGSGREDVAEDFFLRDSDFVLFDIVGTARRLYDSKKQDARRNVVSVSVCKEIE
jgi:hypothetical protein